MIGVRIESSPLPLLVEPESENRPTGVMGIDGTSWEFGWLLSLKPGMWSVMVDEGACWHTPPGRYTFQAVEQDFGYLKKGYDGP